MYETWMPVKPIVHVMIGVNRDLSDEPHRTVFETDEPISIAGVEQKWLTMLHHCFDKTMAPAGKSAVEVWYDTEYDYWEELAKNRKEYDAEKQRIADYTIKQLEKRWPGFTKQVEVVDVPTPHTYFRYTGNWKGSPDGWYVTPENMTDAEKLLWEKLKDRNLFKYKFRRQHPIDIFIVDFYCHQVLLVIEVDGGYHLNSEQKEYDIGRSAELENWDLKIIRFSNDEIFQNLDNVVAKIQEEIEFREMEIKQNKTE